MLDADNYEWLKEEMYGRRHKNLSVTINEILKNYRIMVKSMEKVMSEKDKVEKAKQDADLMIDNYRKQILATAKPLKEI